MEYRLARPAPEVVRARDVQSWEEAKAGSTSGSQHKGRQRVKGQINNTKVGTCRVLADVYFVGFTKREPSARAL